MTEYRKRKAQSTDSVSNDGFASDSNSTHQLNDFAVADNNNSCSAKSCEASPVKSSNQSPSNSSDEIAAESTTEQSAEELGETFCFIVAPKDS